MCRFATRQELITGLDFFPCMGLGRTFGVLQSFGKPGVSNCHVMHSGEGQGEVYFVGVRDL